MEVQIIQPVKTLPKIKDDHVHRVCAYCRVSTDEEDQKHSLASQQDFFARYFDQKPNWINIGIFADKGLSGTSLEKRDAFNEMIRIARQGKVDIILTKEVSRFSRNVQDLLNIVKELRDLGVYIWFLSDDIYTENINYVEPLSIAGNSAQSESLRTSRRVKWGHQQKLQQGVTFGRSEMFGYQIKKDCSGKQFFVVIPEEAEIIIKIFQWFSMGMGTYKIARQLEKIAVQTKGYSNGWNSSVILRILRNEKYVGDLIQGKTYTPDPLTHKKKTNHGEYYRYYIQNHHTPIIERPLWNQVQDILRTNAADDTCNTIYSRRYWCSGKVFCGLCGRRYISLVKRQKTMPYKAWGCIENNQRGKLKEMTRNDGSTMTVGCNSSRINDRVLKLAIRDILEQALSAHREAIVFKCVSELNNDRKPCDHLKKIADIKREIENIESSLDALVLLLSREQITLERYERSYKKQESRKECLVNQLKKLTSDDHKNTDSFNHPVHDIDKIHRIINLQSEPFNEIYFSQIIRKIIIHPVNIMEIYFSSASAPIYLQYKTQGRGQFYTAIFSVLSKEEFRDIVN